VQWVAVLDARTVELRSILRKLIDRIEDRIRLYAPPANHAERTRRPRAPFDDVRAPRAVAAALDLDAFNQAVYSGKAEPARTLMAKSSPFSSDIPLTKTDKNTAQKLFDQLAAELQAGFFHLHGPASVDGPGHGGGRPGPAQHVRVRPLEVQVVDTAAYVGLLGSHDFDMLIGSISFTDSETSLFTTFHGDSRVHHFGIDDDELNAALEAGRTGRTMRQRRRACWPMCSR
jgi:peptide/nickel transport system substrate-binding protein